MRAPSVAPAQQRRSSYSSAPSDSAHNSANDDEAWPSDDGATAVEDEAGSGSDASDSGYEGGPDARHHVTSVFKDRVSVTVNGQDWSHVLLGERGSHEAIVVIFGLEPESDYDVQFLVKAGLDGTHDAFRASLRTRTERESCRSVGSSFSSPSATGSSAVRPASPSPLSRLPVSAPELDAAEPAPRRLAVLQAELEASEDLKATLAAEVKKARKESSKQEAGLRHEIDSIKRGMDRMSATDHRSRQKVLALQELIKQTTIHTKEIHEEAEVTEKEQPEWEEQDAKLEAEVEALRKEVEAEEAAAQAEWDKDEAALSVLEKELKGLEAAAKALEGERDELKDSKLTQIRNEIEKVKEQAKEAFNRPAGYGPRSRGGAAVRGGNRHASGPSHMAANAAGGKGAKAARGGKAGFGNRAVSGPAAGFNSNSNTGFVGASRGFMQSFGKGFRNRNQQGLTHNQGAQSFDSMTSAGFTGPGAGGMLPPGPPGFMSDPMGGYAGGPPYGPLDGFYQPHEQQPFPSGVSEASQDDLYDPTLGFDPYDPSIDARRRSSLPMPQLSYPPQQARIPASSTSSALNPANPEFVPSTTGSNHASPVISKNPSASGKIPASSTAAAAPPIVSTQSPPSGIASVEHSPTSSSRFAFPLARHLPTAGASSSLATKSSSSALASAYNTAGSGGATNVLNLGPADLSVSSTSSMGSNLFSLNTSGSASPFPRHSPLLPQGMETGGSGFSGASPRFAPLGLHSHGEDAFGASSKFGPLDYDPNLNRDSFSAPFAATSRMSSIFNTTGGAAGDWAGNSNSSGWGTSSPPLGSGGSGANGGTGGDIWSASTLPGVSQLRGQIGGVGELPSSGSTSPIGGARIGGLGAIGQASNNAPARSSPLTSPVVASPHAAVGQNSEVETEPGSETKH